MTLDLADVDHFVDLLFFLVSQLKRSWWTNNETPLRRCQHGLKIIRDARCSSSRTSIDAHIRKQISRIFTPNSTTLRVHNQILINCLVARCRKHCWCFHTCSFCPQNIFVGLKIMPFSCKFDFFRNKAKHLGRIHKNAGMKDKWGISRIIAGWLTPMPSLPIEIGNLSLVTHLWPVHFKSNKTHACIIQIIKTNS